MIIYKKEQLEKSNKSIYFQIVNGSIFVYPTDTIYGIGCNATNKDAVYRLKELKQKSKESPLSIIAPSLDWIYKNCIVTKESEEWIKKLPGPYTFILPIKNKDCVVDEVTPHKKTIGIRIPNHWISNFVKKLGFPIVTTSVNIHGNGAMTRLEQMDLEIKDNIDFVIYEGPKNGKPSQIIDLAKEVPIILR